MAVGATHANPGALLVRRRNSDDVLDRDLADLARRLRSDAYRLADEVLCTDAATDCGLTDGDAGADLLSDLEVTLGQLRLLDALLGASPPRVAP